MNSEVVKAPGGKSSHVVCVARTCAVVGWLLACAGAIAAEPVDWASESTGFAPGAFAGMPTGNVRAGSQIEISASRLPRFDNFDGTNRTQQRIDLALLSPGSSSFGVTLGLSSLSPAASRYGFSATPEGLPGVNLGLQWRYILDGNRRIDITAWRDLGRPNDALSLVQSHDGGYGARVEMQLNGSRSSPFVADNGFIGLQLDSGARISLRRSAGKPMVYYRTKF